MEGGLAFLLQAESFVGRGSQQPTSLPLTT
jgi:hypothetical protein